MRSLVIMVAILFGFGVLPASAKPKVLLKRPVASPDGSRYANVEWDDVGFIGIVRMKLWNSRGQLTRIVELPEIKPDPANLLWLDESWIACESFIGTRGSGFFYVHAPTGRAYLLEIVAPQLNSDWVFSIAANDAISTAAVGTISRKQTSYFPLLLRDVPQVEADYFTVEFAEELAAAADAFREFRKQRKFREIEPMSTADIRPNLGGLAVFRIDRRPHVVYFPTGTTSPQEMFSRTEWMPLPEEAISLLNGADPPKPVARWLERGEFAVEGTKPTLDSAASNTSRTLLMKGRFEKAHDEPFTSEFADEEDEPEDSNKKSVRVNFSDEDKSASGKKRPSTSR